MLPRVSVRLEQALERQQRRTDNVALSRAVMGKSLAHTPAKIGLNCTVVPWIPQRQTGALGSKYETLKAVRSGARSRRSVPRLWTNIWRGSIWQEQTQSSMRPDRLFAQPPGSGK